MQSYIQMSLNCECCPNGESIKQKHQFPYSEAFYLIFQNDFLRLALESIDLRHTVVHDYYFPRVLVFL